MTNSQLSAVVITLNEEDTIENCIVSLLKVTDDVIILDSHSTDNTKHICSKYSIRFISIDWTGYGSTKNKVVEYTNRPFILSLDADEVLDNHLIDSINQTQLKQNTIYSFHRKNYYRNKWLKYGGWYPDKKLRIYSRKTRWSNSKVHEELIIPKDYSIELLAGDINHFTIKNHAHYKKTIHKYAKLRAQESYNSGKKVTLFSALTSGVSRFIKTYFIKKGFLDGWVGLVVAIYSIYARILWYKYYRDLNFS